MAYIGSRLYILSISYYQTVDKCYRAIPIFSIYFIYNYIYTIFPNIIRNRKLSTGNK